MEKEIKSVSRIDTRKYRIVYGDDSVSVVSPAGLPEFDKILAKSPVISIDTGADCAICQAPMRHFYRYVWRAKVNPKNNKVLRYDRSKFDEVPLIDICQECLIPRFPWEDGTEQVYEGTLKNCFIGKSVRVEGVEEDPAVCPGKRSFAMGAKCGELICIHRDGCEELGCNPLWVHIVKNKYIIRLEDILKGNVETFLSLEFPFLEPVLCGAYV